MRLVDLDVTRRAEMARLREERVRESLPERRVNLSRARQALHLLEGVDRIEQLRAEDARGRRSVVERTQLAAELRDGRSPRAEAEARQDDVRAQDVGRRGEALSGLNLRANHVGRQPPAVEPDAYGAVEGAVDDDGGPSADLDR